MFRKCHITITLFCLFGLFFNHYKTSDDGHGDHDDHTHDHDNEHTHNDHHDHDHSTNPIVHWVVLLTSLLIVWAVSLVGALVPKKFVKNHNKKLIAFCVGTLFCSIFGEFLPHAASEIIHNIKINNYTQEKGLQLFTWLIFTGICASFFLETIVHYTSGGHAHGHGGCGDDCEEVSGIKTSVGKPSKKSIKKNPSLWQSLCGLPPFVITDLFAKLVHNFVDGILIGSMYLQEISLGLVISISVAVHEISTCLGAYGLYVSAGSSKKVAVFVCALGSMPVLIGGIMMTLLKPTINQSGFLSWITCFSVGLFLYLLLSDLLPLLKHEEHRLHDKNMKSMRTDMANTSMKEKLTNGLILAGCLFSGFFILFGIMMLLPHDHGDR